MTSPVAFFDIDGTLFRSSLFIELIERLAQAEVFPRETPEEYRAEFTAWKNRVGTYEDYIDAVLESFYAHLPGVHYGTLVDVGHEVVRDMGQHVYRYPRDLLASLKARGYFLVAISQSPKTILDRFCSSYGFDKVYGRIYQIDSEARFTGKVVDVNLISDKAAIVRRVYEKEEVRREGSIGVGDTDGDIPLLETVEKPICFNPNALLYTHAKAVGWKVVVERKDVIYEL